MVLADEHKEVPQLVLLLTNALPAGLWLRITKLHLIY